MTAYFTDREYGARPRTVDTIDARLWGGLYSLIMARLGDGSFGQRFPEQCPDGNGPCGCDEQAFRLVANAEVPYVDWPLSPDQLPVAPRILDLLEFCAAAVGQPIEGGYHSYYGHHHLSWDRDVGLQRFVADVNLLFARNGVAYELTPAGQARRLLPQPLAEALAWAVSATGDGETDRLLEVARLRIVSPKTDDRQDALEKLWDAFERLKTLGSGENKRAQADALLDRVAQPGSKLREVLGDEAVALTKIGNTFRIRHSETDQVLLTAAEQIDFLFFRMYAFIHIVLKATARGG
ncbi:MAG: hypothetical protein HYR63_27250 [Proteobacteria bacterium]|nr:hypothetical protein [Pseudomonadota bacterium]MBI3498330.1 hypothetical protein [Pseudomonadota bacterium]